MFNFSTLAFQAIEYFLAARSDVSTPVALDHTLSCLHNGASLILF